MASSSSKRWLLVLAGVAVVASFTAWLAFGSSPQPRAILTVKVGKNPGALTEGSGGEVWVGHAVGCCRSGSLTAIEPDTGDILETVHTEEPIQSTATINSEIWGVTGSERTIVRLSEDDHLTNIKFPGTYGDPTRLEAGDGVLWVGMVPLVASVSDSPSLQRKLDRQAQRANGIIVMYDTDPAGVVRQVQIPNPLTDFVVSGQTLWVASYESQEIYRLETDTGQMGGEVTLSIALPARPFAVAMEGERVWASLDDGTIAVIDIVQEKIVDVVDVNEPATKIAAGEGLIWALQPSERTLVAIDAATRQLVDEIAVGRRPAGVEWVGGYAWVSNAGDDTVTRISSITDR